MADKTKNPLSLYTFDISKHLLILIDNPKQISRSKSSAEKRTKYFSLTVVIKFPPDKPIICLTLL